MIQLKKRDETLIIEIDCETVKDAVLTAIVQGANLRGANLSGANLRRADLIDADLSNSDLSNSDLSGANLSSSDLSGAKNIFSAGAWFSGNFKKNDDNTGFVVYKGIGKTCYAIPAHWVISEGSFIEEIANPVVTVECGCGVNFGTLEYIREYHADAEQIWECLLLFEDMAGLIVPWNTDGKCRCERLQLVKQITL
jgi:hypothetical protein